MTSLGLCSTSEVIIFDQNWHHLSSMLNFCRRKRSFQWYPDQSDQPNRAWVFHSTFWAYLCISQAPLGWSLWSGYHWKDLFLLQKLSIDDVNFGQRWWCQKWNKGQHLLRLVRWHRSLWVKINNYSIQTCMVSLATMSQPSSLKPVRHYYQYSFAVVCISCDVSATTFLILLSKYN